MRFFIALEIPETDRIQIQEVQQKLIQLIPEANLTNPEKLHLTIAFIGDQSESAKEKLIEIIKNSALNIQPFTVTPSYIDGFPHIHTANTLWIGINGEIDELYKLRHHIKDGLESLNLPVDQRRFVPHIAIAKLINFEMTPEIENKLEEIMNQPFSPITITSVKLFESVPDKGLHQHNTLAEIQLISS